MDTTIKPVAYYGDTKITLGKQADGTVLGYDQIDRKQLSAFSLVQGDKEILKLHLEEGQRLIWRKRQFMAAGEETKTIHLVGWQKTIKGENVQAIAYVFDDGHIELAGAFKENHPVFGKVNLHEGEI